MKQALGLVEIQGLPTAIYAADAMVKAANVRMIELENARGLGYMTIKVAGDVGAVTASVNVGRQVGMEYNKLVSWKVIARPSDFVEDYFCRPDPPDDPGPALQPDTEPQPGPAPQPDTALKPDQAKAEDEGTDREMPEAEESKPEPAPQTEESAASGEESREPAMADVPNKSAPEPENRPAKASKPRAKSRKKQAPPKAAGQDSGGDQEADGEHRT